MIKIFKRTDLDIILYGLGFATIAGGFARFNFVAELFVHFALQYFLLSLLLLVTFAIIREKRWKIILSAVLSIYFGIQLISLFPERKIEYGKFFEDIKILQFNINYANPNAKEIAGWINNFKIIDKNIEELSRKTQPDIVVLQEVSVEIAAKLGELEKNYPYKMVKPKSGAFGVAIFSRIPFADFSRNHFPDSSIEYSEIILHSPTYNIPIAFTELHTKPPVYKTVAVERNQELEYIAEVVNKQKTPHKILLGDMNITPYSPWFSDLQEKTKLTNIMQGKVISGTWPSFFPAILRIPIDHMLVSNNIEVLERKVEKDWGSDHLPVFTKLRIYK